MNNFRRKEIQRAIELLEEAKSIIDNCLDDEQEALDNMPESLQQSERCMRMQECVDNLENTSSSIDEAIDFANECLG